VVSIVVAWSPDRATVTVSSAPSSADTYRNENAPFFFEILVFYVVQEEGTAENTKIAKKKALQPIAGRRSESS